MGEVSIAYVLADCLETFEYIHEEMNFNECAWDEREVHCNGVCDITGCVKERIESIRAAISKAKGETT